MRLARHAIAALALLALAAPSFAQSSVTSEVTSGFHGVIQSTPELGPGRPQPSTPNAITVVYDNTTSATLLAISSTDLTSDWGDQLFMTGGGLLSSHAFTLFNSGSSAGNLLTAQVQCDFYDNGTSAFIGGYVTNVNFGAGLPPGFFSIVTVSPLDALLINLPANVICIQTVNSKTGPATRLGVASIDPVTVGSSPTTMYIASATIGAPGFYNLSGPANPGYLVGIAQPPVGTQSSSWGQLKKLYR